ncbi:MAG: bifunctional nuclease family protein [Sedimentisphaerales bacterium]|nr:bifunctional nuclease family protein [Sedimentisphaerales bacterium]
MNIEMELSRIIIQETSDQQFIFLKEINGERSFPIVIGINEAIAIDRRLKGIPTPRPMTHDLLYRTITQLGGRLDRVIINDIRDHTFYAMLIIERDGKLLEIDSRPSDAIALGVVDNTPIFVAEHILDEVT